MLWSKLQPKEILLFNNDDNLYFMRVTQSNTGFDFRCVAQNLQSCLHDVYYCFFSILDAKCDACQYGFYNLSAMNPEGCVACGCDPLGSLDQYCNTDTGQCRCMANRIGRRCDQCANGFKNFTGGCQACGCNSQGTVPNSYCDKTSGQCVCKAYTTGLLCDQCKDGYYELGGAATEGCKDCGCNPAGTLSK